MPDPTTPETPAAQPATPAAPAADATAAAPKRLRVPIADKVAAAMKAHEAAAQKPDAGAMKPGQAPGDKPAAEAKPDAPPEAKAKPPEKPEKSDRLARGFAELTEREARHVEAARQLKDAREKLETERGQLAAERSQAAELRKIRELAKTDPVAAFQASGIDLDVFLEKYVENLKPADPREIARKEFERLQAERDAKADADKKESEAAQQKQFADARAGWIAEVETISRTMGEKFAYEFDLCVAHEITGDQVFARAWAEGLKTGKLPTAKEALALVEADLARYVERSKKYGPKGSGDKRETAARDKRPQTLTPESGGEVPLQSKQNGKPKDARERAREVLRARGLV